MGTIEVPTDRYWGAQTQRSLIHFDIGHDTMPDDGLRASLVINFQKAVDTLLVTIMAVEMSLKAADKSASNDYKKLCRVGPEFQRLDDSDWGSLSFGAGAASELTHNVVTREKVLIALIADLRKPMAHQSFFGVSSVATPASVPA